MARQAERDAVADAKTAKNRAKRQKRKQGKKGTGGGKDGEDGDGPASGAAAGTKRKLEGGAGAIVFRRPGEEADGSDDEREDGNEGADPGPIPAGAAAMGSALNGSASAQEAAPRVIEEPKIAIVDED